MYAISPFAPISLSIWITNSNMKRNYVFVLFLLTITIVSRKMFRLSNIQCIVMTKKHAKKPNNHPQHFDTSTVWNIFNGTFIFINTFFFLRIVCFWFYWFCCSKKRQSNLMSIWDNNYKRVHIKKLEKKQKD